MTKNNYDNKILLCSRGGVNIDTTSETQQIYGFMQNDTGHPRVEVLFS